MLQNASREFLQMKARTFHRGRNFYHDGKKATAASFVATPNHLDFSSNQGVYLFGMRRARRRAGVFVEAVDLGGEPGSRKGGGGRQTVFV